MNNLNSLQIIGNVGATSELRYTPNGKPVTNFSVATNRKYTRDDKVIEETDWFSVTVFGKLAEICSQFVKKSQLVFVSGRVSLHEWDGQDGQKRSRLEVHANRVIFLSRTSDKSATEPEPEPEDLPF